MDWDAFLPQALTLAAGCPRDAAISKLRLAAIDLFRRTGAWRDDAISAGTTVVGTTAYTVTIPAGAQIERMTRFQVGEDASDDDTPAIELARSRLHAEQMLRSGEKPVAWWAPPATANVLPAPVVPGLPVVFGAVFVPTLDSAGIPDEVAAPHFEAIVHGAAYRLLEIPNKPWSDPRSAQQRRQDYERAVMAATVAAGVGRVQGRLRARPSDL